MIPGFLSEETCRSLLAQLEARPLELTTTVVVAEVLPLEVTFNLSDFRDPLVILGKLRTPAGLSLLRRYATPAELRTLARAKGVEDVTEETGDAFAAVLERATGDPLLARTLADQAPLTAGGPLSASVARLRACGLIEDDASTPAALPRGWTPEERLALSWFNIDFLEGVVFAGGLEKQNRVFRHRTTPEVLAARLAAPPREGLPAPVAVLDRPLKDRGWPALLHWFARLFSDDASRSALLRAYLPAVAAELPSPVRATAADWSSGKDLGRREACFLLQLVLASLYRDELLTPTPPGVARGVRSSQVVAIGDPEPYRELFERLRRDHVEPFFHLRVRPAYEDFHVLRYHPGGYHLTHVDSEKLDERDGQPVWVKVLPRDVSVLIYLSAASDFSGGALRFPGLDLTIRPDRGLAVAFPSDHRFPHAVEPVTQGARHVIVAFLRCAEGAASGA